MKTNLDTKVVIAAIIAIFIVLGILIFLSGRIDPQRFAVDFHSHTDRSDPFDPHTWTLSMNMQWHETKHFDAVFITDHVGPDTPLPWDAISPEEASWNSNHTIQAYHGIEWTTESYHILFLNVTSWSIPVPVHPTDADTQASVNACHLQHGIAILAHVNYYPGTNLTHLLTLGVDGVEVLNDATPPYFFDASAYNCIKVSDTDSHNALHLYGCSYMPDSNVMANLIANRIDNVRF